MSFSQPSQVSATTGSDHQYPVASAAPCATRQAMAASRTTPTLWVLVIITGPSRNPDSSTQAVPVISPLPFCANQAANTGLDLDSGPRGSTAVTPVRTGPLPTRVCPNPMISVVCPTSTPATSVMALSGPGSPSNGTPRSRARAFGCAAPAGCAGGRARRRRQVAAHRRLRGASGANPAARAARARGRMPNLRYSRTVHSFKAIRGGARPDSTAPAQW